MINLKLILTSLILFSTLFSNIIIKTGNNEIKLKKGMLFSINSDKTKITYNSFNENLINNSIDVNSIEKITIYNYKKKNQYSIKKNTDNWNGYDKLCCFH